MAIYTHNEIAVPGDASWFNVNIDGNNPITATSTLLVLRNSDGTETRIMGTDFMYDADGKPTGYWSDWLGEWFAGSVTQIDRTSIGGITVYETITLEEWGFDLVSVFAALTSTPDDGGNRSSFPFIFDFSDTFNGFSGDDVFGGVGFGDTFYGSGGTDTVSYDDAFYGVRADLGNPTTNTGDAAGDTYTSIENLSGSDFDDRLFGNSSVNVLSGGLGNDFLDGKGGDDTMVGGAGDDLYLVDSASDLVTENPGEGNHIVFASVDYTIGPNIESLGRWLSGDNTVIGGAGDDIYLVDSTSGVVMENPGEGNDTVYALVDYTLGANIEGLVLVEGEVWYINGTGNNLNNALVGNSRNNVLDGKGGDDTMIGGAGNDTYYVDSAGDLVTENSDGGFDRVYASVDYTIGPNIEGLVLEGAGNINGFGNNTGCYLSGNSGNNTLIGGDGGDTFAGGGGDDTMIGGAGNDWYEVDSTSDVVIENLNEGIDGVYASVDYTLGPTLEWLSLFGTGNINGVGNDLNNGLRGNSGNNTLIGGDGDDSLDGGPVVGSNGPWGSGGDDTLIGGAGNDWYHVDSTSDLVTENLGEGFDTVYASSDYTLSPNIESLVLDWMAPDNSHGSGNNLDNTLVGNYAGNVLDGKGGQDVLTGGNGRTRSCLRRARLMGTRSSTSKGTIMPAPSGTASASSALAPPWKERPSPRSAPPTSGRSIPGSTGTTSSSRS
jgi:trimeric autotransporter adhesin